MDGLLFGLNITVRSKFKFEFLKRKVFDFIQIEIQGTIETNFF